MCFKIFIYFIWNVTALELECCWLLFENWNTVFQFKVHVICRMWKFQIYYFAFCSLYFVIHLFHFSFGHMMQSDTGCVDLAIGFRSLCTIQDCTEREWLQVHTTPQILRMTWKRKWILLDRFWYCWSILTIARQI